MSAVSDSAKGCKPAEVLKAPGGFTQRTDVKTTGSSVIIPSFSRGGHILYADCDVHRMYTEYHILQTYKYANSRKCTMCIDFLPTQNNQSWKPRGLMTDFISQGIFITWSGGSHGMRCSCFKQKKQKNHGVFYIGAKPQNICHPNMLVFFG